MYVYDKWAVFEAGPQNWFRWRLWACDSAGFIRIEVLVAVFAGPLCRFLGHSFREKIGEKNSKLVELQ